MCPNLPTLYSGCDGDGVFVTRGDNGVGLGIPVGDDQPRTNSGAAPFFAAVAVAVAAFAAVVDLGRDGDDDHGVDGLGGNSVGNFLHEFWLEKQLFSNKSLASFLNLVWRIPNLSL